MSEVIAPTTSDQLETAKERAEARKDSIKQELEDLDRFIDWADQGIEIARSLEARNGGAPAALPPVEPEPTKPPPRRKPAAPGKRRSPNAIRDAVLGFVRQHPGCTQKEIIDGTGVGQGSVSRNVIKAERRGEIRREDKAIYPSSAEGKADAGESPASAAATEPDPEPTPPSSVPAAEPAARPDPEPESDPDPPAVPEFQGELEPQIYDVLKERPLTVPGIALKLKQPGDAVGATCFRMHKRGLLDRLDVKDPPVRYAIKT